MLIHANAVTTAFGQNACWADLLSVGEKPHFSSNSSQICVRLGCRSCHRYVSRKPGPANRRDRHLLRRKEKLLCLVRLVRSSHAASVVGSSAFTWGANVKRASAPTTIEPFTARCDMRRLT